MNKELEKMMLLVEYDSKYGLEKLYESRKTETEALNILSKNNPSVSNDVHAVSVEEFKKIDKTKNQILLPIIAQMYIELDNEDHNQRMNKIKSIVNSINNLINKNKITKIQTTKETPYIINNKPLKNFASLSNYVHGIESLDRGVTQYKDRYVNVETNEKPIFPDPQKGHKTDTGIEVYDGNDMGRCIKYTMGGLTGRSYNFCIGQPSPATNLWKQHRDIQSGTFYYVIDKTRSLNDPLHIVVVNHTEDGYELTDANNITGNIAEFEDSDAYMNYLEGKGVPINEIFKNIPKTPEEEERFKRFSKTNPNLDWFKELSFDDKLTYIGYANELTDEQFNYLWELKNISDGAFTLMTRYIDTGKPLPENQFDVLVGKSQEA